MEIKSIYMNTFFIYKVDDKFVKVTKTLRLRLTDDIMKANYWTKLSSAKTWKHIQVKYPNAQLIQVKLTL